MNAGGIDGPVGDEEWRTSGGGTEPIGLTPPVKGAGAMNEADGRAEAPIRTAATKVTRWRTPFPRRTVDGVERPSRTMGESRARIKP